MAASADGPNIVRILLAYGAAEEMMDIEGHGGRTALHRSCTYKSSEVFKLLLDAIPPLLIMRARHL